LSEEPSVGKDEFSIETVRGTSGKAGAALAEGASVVAAVAARDGVATTPDTPAMLGVDEFCVSGIEVNAFVEPVATGLPGMAEDVDSATLNVAVAAAGEPEFAPLELSEADPAVVLEAFCGAVIFLPSDSVATLAATGFLTLDDTDLIVFGLLAAVLGLPGFACPLVPTTVPAVVPAATRDVNAADDVAT
jgi:hypothetical protein